MGVRGSMWEASGGGIETLVFRLACRKISQNVSSAPENKWGLEQNPSRWFQGKPNRKSQRVSIDKSLVLCKTSLRLAGFSHQWPLPVLQKDVTIRASAVVLLPQMCVIVSVYVFYMLLFQG